MPHGDQMDRLQQVLDGFNAHDLDAILSHFAEDCVFDSSRGPRVEALFDSACNALDENYDPIPPKLAVERLEDCVRTRYAATARTASPVGGARRERAASSPPSTTGSLKASTPST